MPPPRLPRSAYHFSSHALVECPRCGRAADVAAGPPFLKARLTCAACGLARERDRSQGFLWVGGEASRKGIDPYFGLPLWLRQPVGREVVWAYDWRHLEDLEFFVAGDWRTHRHNLGLPGYQTTWSFRTRYPKWMHEGANRAAILRALRQIRGRRLAPARA